MEQQKSAVVNLPKQGLLFLIVGSLTALVHFLSLIMLVQIFHHEPVFANVLAFLIAFIFGFIGHLKFTFHAVKPQVSWKVSLTKWFVSSLFGFALNQSIFTAGIIFLGQQYYMLIWLIATGLVTICTFVLAKFWAFKGKYSS